MPLRETIPEVHTEIYRTTVGSELHGVHVPGHEDHDEMGVAVEHPQVALGLSGWEHSVQRTQPEGVRSGPDDTDRTIYSLRKFARLASHGNPSILVLLFAPKEFALVETPLGDELRENRDLFASKRAGRAFLGYLHTQREKMIRGSGAKVSRPELVEQYGYDTKYAMHMLRLGFQGMEYLQFGTITLPMPEPERQTCLDVRIGKHPREWVLEQAAIMEATLKAMLGTTLLPDAADASRISGWLASAYLRCWMETV